MLARLRRPSPSAFGIACVLGALLACLILSNAARSQGWTPQRHVEVTVPNAQGSSLDITARTFHKLWHDLKLAPVTSSVVNRQGGEQAIAYSYLRQRTGDAHYLSFANPALLMTYLGLIQ